jgi:hypothetical protein
MKLQPASHRFVEHKDNIPPGVIWDLIGHGDNFRYRSSRNYRGAAKTQLSKFLARKITHLVSGAYPDGY